MKIEEFLAARIAEDEARGRGSVPGPWRVIPELDEVQSTDFRVATGFALGSATLEHIAENDPLRTLAECAFKRVVLQEISRFGGVMLDYDCPGTVLAKSLAAVYAEHPDYDETWRLDEARNATL